jgi:hypothetical protein
VSFTIQYFMRGRRGNVRRTKPPEATA